MLNLIIEVCTDRGVVAITDGDQILFSEELPVGFNNSKYVLPYIQTGLTKLKMSIKDLKIITLGIGPGSYTGIRIGAIVAKSLALATHIPLIGICSLESFIPRNDGQFAAIIDAKIGGCYLLLSEKKSDEINCLSDPKVESLEKIMNLTGNITYFITPQKNPLREKLNKLFPDNNFVWEESFPNINHLNKLAVKRFETGQYCFAADPLPLLYLRKTQAELELI